MATMLCAKKRRRKSSSVGNDDDNAIINYRQTAEKSIKENSIGDETDDDKDDTDTTTDDGIPNQTTLSGGSSLMFEMARRMLVWDDELYDSEIINDAGSRKIGEGTKIPPTNTASSLSAEYLNGLPSTSSLAPPQSTSSAAGLSESLPRWRPSAIRQQSISNVNPSFRTSSPVMTNVGYAGILRRNSRKKNKPSMWRHCLRVYDKMAALENEAVGKKKVRRSTAHHEAALVAASKLGMWEEALLIYRGVEESSSAYRSADKERGRSRVTDNMLLSVISACVKGSKVKRTTASLSDVDTAPSVDDDVSSDDATNKATDVINGTNPDNTTTYNDVSLQSPSRPMIRALTIEERRKPLDAARDILISIEEKHDIPLVSRHINQLASAYVRLGLRSEAAALINGQLQDRMPTPPTPQRFSYTKKSKQWTEERETIIVSDNPGFEGVKLVDWSDDDLDDDYDEDGYEESQLNVHQVKAKDRGSYSLLVQGAAMEGDWTGAVQELQRMTDAGLHPNTRNLNSWSEVLERGCRPSGNGEKSNEDNGAAYYYGGRQRRRSWKKKRDGIWLGNLR